ncbi:Vitamin B12 import ATP-binding protein BtuD [Dyadobacter sp. CECT 9275]|uniref:Vitamin B12 import ATP-binding protein BtuD n=1 Tax=Dyadobacter helix TaxID=2822344 RepID=A0A916JDX9_9BACT|nr:polysaccharide ABC transporter ATP-binding protein [Dyadobacter sp. CECT 9275]CAG5007959.1 Vitamin B12 import ATP-binding protein BtuD [Dyadobacter sp. CECT 9275]
MSDTVIQVDNVSKLYQLGEISTGTLSRDLHRWWTQLRGKEDPFQKIGQTNDRTVRSSADFVWALKDISFEVKQGEVLGIIGRNGAGKSTLLKILSRVTKPTSGRIRVKGRIASLLEVGTGFHPELTGRENIFLNGAIMGMTKTEIKSKLDEIIAFAGVERYIDTPVKRYSSGMYVRLAFAVAAHLDPEILVIDEVLAVGDAEFQKKCLGKMKDVSEKEGRTVLFVSHNMDAVQKLCTKGIVLNNGTVRESGSIKKVLLKYVQELTLSKASFEFGKPVVETAGYVEHLSVEDLNGKLLPEVQVGDNWQVRIRFTLMKEINHFIIGLGITAQLGFPVHTSWSIPVDLKEGTYEAIFINDVVIYTSGLYYLDVGLSSFLKTFQFLEQLAYIQVSDVPNLKSDQVVNTRSGVIINQMKVNIVRKV